MSNDPVQLIMDRMEDKKKKQNQWDKMLAENEELAGEYSKALNGMARSEYGKYFLKTLVNYLDLHNFKQSLEPRDIFLERGKRQVYLELIRPYLDESVRKEIE